MNDASTKHGQMDCLLCRIDSRLIGVFVPSGAFAVCLRSLDASSSVLLGLRNLVSLLATDGTPCRTASQSQRAHLDQHNVRSTRSLVYSDSHACRQDRLA